MEKAELTFAVFLAAFGLVQTGANIYHLTRGSKAKIALSSMSMHGELPRDLPDGQYVAKAWIMLGFGLSFLLATFLPGTHAVSFCVLAALWLHAILQALRHQTFATTVAAIVYGLPFVLYCMFVGV
jgi:hypothetical protein